MLAIVGLEACRARYPHELSGGQQQRVALARALAPQPDLVLLDEPFSNLDIDLRGRLSLEVREILKQVNATALLVTHDQNEAFAMADLVGVMQNGRLSSGCAVRAVSPSGDALRGGFHWARRVPARRGTGCRRRVHGTGRPRGRVPSRYGAGSQIDLLLRPDDVLYDEAVLWRSRSCSGFSVAPISCHAGPAGAARHCCRWCRATSPTAWVIASASGSSSTISSVFPRAR